MASRAGGNSRASKYDYLIKLLLIGDSGKQFSTPQYFNIFKINYFFIIF